MKLVVLALALFASSADAANTQDISYMCATRKIVSPSDDHLFNQPPMDLTLPSLQLIFGSELVRRHCHRQHDEWNMQWQHLYHQHVHLRHHRLQHHCG